MRALMTMMVVVLPWAATAQEQPAVQRPILKITGDPGGLTPEDRTAYCFWAGQLYSIGAAFCSRQQTLITCTEMPGRRPVWVAKENDKFCDRNTSPTPQ
jgi:hypothetical protein